MDRFNQPLNLSISDWGDWFITCLLGLIVAYAVYHLGGHHPKAELEQSWMLGGLLVVHGAFMLLQPLGTRRIYG